MWPSLLWLLLTGHDKSSGLGGGLGPRPGSATSPVGDLGQVTAPISKMGELDLTILSSLRLSSVKCPLEAHPFSTYHKFKESRESVTVYFARSGLGAPTHKSSFNPDSSPVTRGLLAMPFHKGGN